MKQKLTAGVIFLALYRSRSLGSIFICSGIGTWIVFSDLTM